MKRTRKSLISAMLVAATAVLLVTMMSMQDKKPWDIPDKYKKMENPVKADDASLKMGAMLYKKHCASCHGRTGLGDGVKARSLETHPGDMSKEDFKSQTDGEVFYMSKFGRDEMPSYEGKLADEDIWNLVNYMKSL